MQCQIEWVTIFNIVITAIAAFIAFINFKAFIRFSDINVDSSIQQLMLTKAKECNSFFEQSEHGRFMGIPHAPQETAYIKVITEMIISLQLLDNSLNSLTYKSNRKSKKRNFFLLQFWIQLNTTLREYIKRKNRDGIPFESDSIPHKAD